MAVILRGYAVIGFVRLLHNTADNVITSINNRSDSHTVTLEQVGNIQVSKKVDMTLDDQNDNQAYEISWANFASAYTVDAPTIIDVLPYNGDGAAQGSERTPASDYQGTLQLTAAPVITWLDGTTPTGSDPNPELGTWYYTNEAPGSINADPDQNTTDWCLESNFNSGAAGCPVTFADVTAMKFVSNYLLEKDGNPRQGMKATFSLQASGNEPGNIYTNRFTFDSPSLPAEQYLRSNNVSVYIASYSLGDLVFADINNNGQYDAATDRVVPDGVTVNLHAADGTLLKSTTTGLQQPGRYLFAKLASGDYYVEIPASEFQAGGRLAGWDSAFTSAAAADDNNETQDQDGYKVSDPATAGVRSNIITLSAIPPLPGQVPKGDEPLGDNSAGLVDETGDDFSNYTLDIALLAVFDFGDAPVSFGVAPHLKAGVPSPYLGVIAPDSEASTPHGVAANGDGQDEDAIKAFPDWEIGRQCSGLLPDGTQGTVTVSETRYCMTVKAVNPTVNQALVVGWIDFDGDGSFNESNERSSVVLDDNPANDVSQGNVPANSVNQTIVLTWEGVTRPANPTYARIRISTDADLKRASGLSATASALDGEVEDYALSFDAVSTTVSGRVYKDVNADGVNDVSEAGVSELPVVLINTDTNTCISTRTDGDGYYQFTAVPQGNYQVYEASQESVPIPQNCGTGFAKDPSGYTSTTPNILTTFAVTDTPVTDKDFGDVKLPTWQADNAQEILPGNVAYYTHTFVSPSSGSVTFSLSENAPEGWSSLLYRDTDCDGTLSTAEGTSPLTSSITTLPAETVCVVHKVFAPSSASNGQQSLVALTADFVYGTGTTQADTQVLVNTDTTTVVLLDTADKAGKLELLKSVQNITQGTPETETQNTAKPGDVLQYRITYRNTGTAAITDLAVNDSAPAFTVYVNGTAACPNTPSTLSCSADPTNAPDMQWRFTGTLPPGDEGNVVYRVQIE